VIFSLKRFLALSHVCGVALYFLCAVNKAGIDPNLWYEFYHDNQIFIILSLCCMLLFSEPPNHKDKAFLFLVLIVSLVCEIWYKVSGLFTQIEREDITRGLGVLFLALIFATITYTAFKHEN